MVALVLLALLAPSFPSGLPHDGPWSFVSGLSIDQGLSGSDVHGLPRGKTGLLGFGTLPLSSGRDSQSPARYQEKVFPRVLVTSDIIYTRAVDKNGRPIDLRLDIYEPEGDAALKRPVMVWIHGGGFFQGDKTELAMVRLAKHFGKCGFVCASIDYRLMLTSSADWISASKLRAAVEAGVKDTRAAIRYLVGARERFRLDVSRLTIGGGSAGAFLAMHTACGDKSLLSGAKIRAVVDFWGGLFDYSLMKRTCPPILVIHGTEDKVVPFEFAKRLVARAKETGVVYTFRPLIGEGHSAWHRMDQYLAWIGQFLRMIGLVSDEMGAQAGRRSKNKESGLLNGAILKTISAGSG